MKIINISERRGACLLGIYVCLFIVSESRVLVIRRYWIASMIIGRLDNLVHITIPTPISIWYNGHVGDLPIAMHYASDPSKAILFLTYTYMRAN